MTAPPSTGVALDHLDVEPVPGQVAGRDQGVVAAADHDDVPGCHPPEPTRVDGVGASRGRRRRVERLGPHAAGQRRGARWCRRRPAACVVRDRHLADGAVAARTAVRRTDVPAGATARRRCCSGGPRRAAGAAGRRPERRPRRTGSTARTRGPSQKLPTVSRQAVRPSVRTCTGWLGGPAQVATTRSSGARHVRPQQRPGRDVSTTVRPRASTRTRVTASGEVTGSTANRSCTNAEVRRTGSPGRLLVASTVSPAGPAGARPARCRSPSRTGGRSGRTTRGSGPTCR